MVHFKLKGDRQSSWGVRVNGQKVHLSGGDRIHDSDSINKVKADWNSLKIQLGSNIIWSDEVPVEVLNLLGKA